MVAYIVRVENRRYRLVVQKQRGVIRAEALTTMKVELLTTKDRIRQLLMLNEVL